MTVFLHALIFLMIGFSSLSLAEAFAETYSNDVFLYGPIESTNISGFKGTPYEMDGTSSTHAIYGFRTRERRDQECHIAAQTENVNDSDDDSQGDHFDKCGGAGKSRELSVQYQDGGLAESRVFVSAIRLCMNKKRTRMKGIQIQGRKVTDDGNPVPLITKPYTWMQGGGGGTRRPPNLSTAPRDWRINCQEDEWKSWAECPKDSQIATGATIHFEAGKKPRAITGIALQCRYVGTDPHPQINRAGK